MKIVRCRMACIIQHHFVKIEGEQDYCMCLANICRWISIKDKLEEWLAASRNGYWAEQVTGLGRWLFTIYLFIASLLWKTHYFSHLLSMNYSSAFVSCLCDLFHGLVRKWWLMVRAWQVEYNGHYLSITMGPNFKGSASDIWFWFSPSWNTSCLLLSAYRP